jgi:hypothetical protein
MFIFENVQKERLFSDFVASNRNIPHHRGKAYHKPLFYQKIK